MLVTLPLPNPEKERNGCRHSHEVFVRFTAGVTDCLRHALGNSRTTLGKEIAL